MFHNNALDTQELMQRIANDLIDSYDEEIELEIEDREGRHFLTETVREA